MDDHGFDSLCVHLEQIFFYIFFYNFLGLPRCMLECEKQLSILFVMFRIYILLFFLDALNVWMHFNVTICVEWQESYNGW